MSDTKTHWLQNPNKNYLGHWDLPEGKDIVLTIKSAKWEEVINPVYKKGHPKYTEARRVIRFVEKYKPLICNQTNAQSIIKSTGVKFMEDSEGSRIQLFIGTHNDRKTKEDVDCVRIRREEKMSSSQIHSEIKKLFEQKKNELTETEKESVIRIIDNEETLSYQKVFNYLKKKVNGQ